MSAFAIVAALIVTTALLAYLNERFIGLPPTIGVMAAALFFSIVLIASANFGLSVDQWAESLFAKIDFSAVLMDVMLSFLLFAGSLHVDLTELLKRKWLILSLATIGVVLSTALVGSMFYFLLGALGLSIPFIFALLFGSLISPTDPVAVLGILKSAGAPKSLQSMIIGESLFNDGVGVVVFTMILGIATGSHGVTPVEVAKLFCVEAIGGAVYGGVLGYLGFRLLRTINNHTVEILITLALVTGGYVLAGAMHTSGPIAMVIAGLMMGNHGRVFGMTEESRKYLDTFWEVVDEILNALLFVMIGFELLVLEMNATYLLVGAISVPLVLVVRYLCVGGPVSILRRFKEFPRHSVGLMTWGGIRGGISIALALSLPDSRERDLILVVTYAIVVFSILVPGLTLKRAVKWASASP